jgi:hypothetical protein
MFTVWTVYASLSASPSTPLIPLPLSSNGRGTHRFVQTAVVFSTVSVPFCKHIITASLLSDLAIYFEQKQHTY